MLEQEEELHEQRMKLEEWIAKDAELAHLKENDIKQLKSQHRLWEEKLEQLNEEAKNAKYLLERYQSELSEDGRLIRNLPDQYGTIQSVDSLIASLKEQEYHVQNMHSSYEQGLMTLIEQIRISYEKLKGNSHE